MAITGAPDNFGDAADDRRGAVDIDPGAHAGQFRNMHEAVLENGLGNHAGPFGGGHQGHQLGLHVGGETGIGFGHDIDAADADAVGVDAHAARRLGNLDAGLGQNFLDRLHQIAPGPDQFDIAPG